LVFGKSFRLEFRFYFGNERRVPETNWPEKPMEKGERIRKDRKQSSALRINGLSMGWELPMRLKIPPPSDSEWVRVGEEKWVTGCGEQSVRGWVF